MGVCTATVKKRHLGVGAGVEIIADVNLSSSYATGGDTVSLASLGADTIQALILCSNATTATGHAVEVIHGATDKTAPLLRVRDSATGVEITNTTDLSAQKVRVIAKANYAFA